MPDVIAPPRSLRNGEVITEFTDTTSTTAITYTYPIRQAGLSIENSGIADIFVTVGSFTNQVINPNKKWKEDVSFTSFSVRSDANSQEFTATAFQNDAGGSGEADSGMINALTTRIDKGEIFKQNNTAVGSTYNPLGLHFKRKSAGRNYYNKSISLGKLDMSSDPFIANGNLYPKTNITTNGLTFEKSGNKLKVSNPLAQIEESAIEVCGMFTYGVYEIDVDSVTMNGYTASIMPMVGRSANGSSSCFTVWRHSGTAGITATPLNTTVSSIVPVAPYTIRVQTYGTGMAVFYVKDGNAQLLGELDFSTTGPLGSGGFDWNSTDRDNWKFYLRFRLGAGESVVVSRAESLLSCGSGQADIRPIKYKDGAPMIIQGKLWLTMSVRGFAQSFGQSFAGIFSLDIDTMKLNLEGAIFRDSGGALSPIVGIGIVYDEDAGEWIIFAGDRIGSTKKDPRRGINIVIMGFIVHPYTNTNLYYWIEDPDLIYDESVGKWRVTFGILYKVGGDPSYPEGTVLVEADDWRNPFTEVSPPSPYTRQETGSTFQSIGGSRYVLAGAGDDKMNVYNYPQLQLMGQLNLDVSHGGFRPWPCIVPIPDGRDRTKYILITFDRGLVHGAYSYGALYFYEAVERNTGYEFKQRNYGATL